MYKEVLHMYIVYIVINTSFLYENKYTNYMYITKTSLRSSQDDHILYE